MHADENRDNDQSKDEDTAEEVEMRDGETKGTGAIQMMMPVEIRIRYMYGW
jgi:hypothetical protein